MDGIDTDKFVIFQQDDLHIESFPLMKEIRRQGKLCDVTLKVSWWTTGCKTRIFFHLWVIEWVTACGRGGGKHLVHTLTLHENECVIFVTGKHDKITRFFVRDCKLLCMTFHTYRCVHRTRYVIFVLMEVHTRYGQSHGTHHIIWPIFFPFHCFFFFFSGGRSVVLRTSHRFSRNNSILLCDVHAWHGRKSCERDYHERNRSTVSALLLLIWTFLFLWIC